MSNDYTMPKTRSKSPNTNKNMEFLKKGSNTRVPNHSETKLNAPNAEYGRFEQDGLKSNYAKQVSNYNENIAKMCSIDAY